jgi:hypothetical protein
VLHEATLSTQFARQYKPTFKTIILSAMTSQPRLLQPRTYGWVSELHYRKFFIEAVKKHPFQNKVKNRLPGCVAWPQPNICQTCVDKTMEASICYVMDVLYDITDLRWPNSTDEVQKKFIENLSFNDLAFLYVITCTVAEEYEYLAVPPGRSVLELQCVFREAVLTYGPFFIWASIGNNAQKDWVAGQIQRGLREIGDYETVHNSDIMPIQPSIQRTLLQSLCQTAKCYSYEAHAVAHAGVAYMIQCRTLRGETDKGSLVKDQRVKDERS